MRVLEFAQHGFNTPLFYAPDSAALASLAYRDFRTRVLWEWNLADDSVRQTERRNAGIREPLTHAELVTGQLEPRPKIPLPSLKGRWAYRMRVCRAQSAPIFAQLVRFRSHTNRHTAMPSFAILVRHADEPRRRPLIEWTTRGYSYQLALSGDGGRVAVNVGYGVRVWDTDTRAELGTARSGRCAPNAFALSADGRYLGVCFQDFVTLFDAATGAAVRSYSWKVGRLSGLAFSPDGATAAVIGGKGKVVVFDLE